MTRINSFPHTTKGEGRCGLKISRQGLLRYMVAECGYRRAVTWANSNKTEPFVEVRFKTKDDRARFMERFAKLTAKTSLALKAKGDIFAYSPMTLTMVR